MNDEKKLNEFLSSFDEKQKGALESFLATGDASKLHDLPKEAEKTEAPKTNEVKEDGFRPLTAEEYEKADPVLKAYHDEFTKFLEQEPDLPEHVQSFIQDPLVAARLQEIKSGREGVDFSAKDFVTEDVFKALEELFVTEGKEPEAKEALITLIDAHLQRAKLAGIALQKDEAVKAYEAGRKEVWYEVNLASAADKIPEFKSPEKVIIDTKDGKAINPNHPIYGFTKWMNDEIQAGRLTEAAVQHYGIDFVHNQWKISSAGSVGAHVNSIKRAGVEELRKQMQDAKKNGLAKLGVANTLGLGQSGKTVEFLHGIDIERAKKDPAYQRDVSMRIDGMPSAQAREVTAKIWGR